MWTSKGSKINPPRRGATRRCRPGCESLEDRVVLAQVGLVVSSLADSGAGSLRAAILSADAGRAANNYTIDFSVTGTIALQSPLPDLKNAIAIEGPGAGSLTVERDAGYSFSSAIFNVAAGKAASLSGLTIADGNAGGVSNNGGALAVVDCTVSDNSDNDRRRHRLRRGHSHRR